MMFACRRCDADIPRDVSRCPECEYNPGGAAKDVAAIGLGLSVPLLYVVPPAGVLLVMVGILLFGWSLLASPARRII